MHAVAGALHAWALASPWACMQLRHRWVEPSAASWLALWVASASCCERLHVLPSGCLKLMGMTRRPAAPCFSTASPHSLFFLYLALPAGMPRKLAAAACAGAALAPAFAPSLAC